MSRGKKTIKIGLCFTELFKSLASLMAHVIILDQLLADSYCRSFPFHAVGRVAVATKRVHCIRMVSVSQSTWDSVA